MKQIYTLVVLLAIALFVVSGCKPSEGTTPTESTNAPAAPSTNK